MGTPADELNRLYVVEPVPTVTGAQRRSPAAAEGARRSRVRGRARRRASAPARRRRRGARRRGAPKWITAVAADLQAHKGRSAVVAGDHQPAAVHALARAMNEALGNVGTTVIYTAPVAASPADGAASLAELVADMNAGKVDVLVDARRQPGLHGAGRSRTSATRSTRSARACTSASTTTKPPSCATGTCPKRTTSSRGATCARSTARSRLMQPLDRAALRRPHGARGRWRR